MGCAQQLTERLFGAQAGNEAAIAESKARFDKLQTYREKVYSDLLKENATDDVILRTRIRYVGGQFTTRQLEAAVRPTYLPEDAPPKDFMFRRQEKPEWYMGWQEHDFMLDGMPFAAPDGFVQREPAQPGPNPPKNKICERHYNHKYRGHPHTCPEQMQKPREECWYAHSLLSGDEAPAP
jgi:hypothetical protein